MRNVGTGLAKIVRAARSGQEKTKVGVKGGGGGKCDQEDVAVVLHLLMRQSCHDGTEHGCHRRNARQVHRSSFATPALQPAHGILMGFEPPTCALGHVTTRTHTHTHTQHTHTHASAQHASTDAHRLATTRARTSFAL